jgi:dipeptidyl aminopeptidase/acylaminoacyl peptidase
MRAGWRRGLCTVVALAAVVAADAGEAVGSPAMRGAGELGRQARGRHANRPANAARAGALGVRRLKIDYVAHDGRPHLAYVLLPARYTPEKHPPIPLVIAPHGRGISAGKNAWRWKALPTVGSFAVVSPEGQGRLATGPSWGYEGQIEDLAKMPAHVTRALPWVDIDLSRIYAFGASMGAQESLLLAGRHPELLAGVAAFDAVTDLARQYRNFARLRCNLRCVNRWGMPIGTRLRQLVREEVGGAPATAPDAYAARSPLADAHHIALSGVPIQLWWSTADKVVLQQSRQSGLLFRAIRRMNRFAPVEAFIGSWPHTRMMWANAHGLRFALAEFHLLPRRPTPGRTWRRARSGGWPR